MKTQENSEIYFQVEENNNDEENLIIIKILEVK